MKPVSFSVLMLLLGLGLVPFTLRAQEPAPAGTQTVKGRLTDAQSQYPLPGAIVVVVGSNPLIGATADEDGYYRLKNVPLGRQTLKVSGIGYKERIIPNVLVTQGKEVVLDLGLEESIVTSEEVTVTQKRDIIREEARNEMALVSARTFRAEEAARYAGSRADVARMAANFAGVSGVNDGRNDIIIRGNSPLGMLYRLDGVDIPNPTHFGTAGATGGPVGMLNNNVLGRSDFMTAAFPAEYGNALSGVFDLSMRNGNRDKREFLGQIGFNGFELGAEGPMGNKGASYLVNYRYSTLGLFKAVGLSFTGAAVPEYQDLSFKLNFPLSKRSQLSIFGLGGFASVQFNGKDEDSTNLYSDAYTNLYSATRSGTIGVNHQFFFNERTYGKLTLSASGTFNNTRVDSLSQDQQTVFEDYRDRATSARYSARYILNHKFSARATLNTGVYVDYLDFSFRDSVKEYPANAPSRWRRLRNSEGNTVLTQGHATLQYRFTDRLTGNAGLHAQHLNLSNSTAIEPRSNWQYALNERQSLSLGVGLHSQMQTLPAYFVTTREADGSYRKGNTDLGFTRAWHYVLGYNLALTPKTRLKAEVYYQSIFDAPVASKPSSYSLLNFGSDFGYPEENDLVNEGTGSNRGIELTVERFFSDGYYFLWTTSLFESKYKGSDGIERNTAFAGNYVVNVLGGKEWKIRDKNAIALDVKFTAAGGRRYTPFDVQRSIAEGTAIRLENEAFSRRFSDYYRADVKLSYRINGKRTTQEIFVDLQNITNRLNDFQKGWSRVKGREYTIPQVGLFPIPGYRLTF